MRPSLSPLEYGAYGTSFNEESTFDGGPQAPVSCSGRAAMSADSLKGAILIIIIYLCGGGGW
jgi:hypothetical protein